MTRTHALPRTLRLMIAMNQCAYEVGALQFRALYAELVDSGKMTNRQFHDAVLQLNSMPVEMIRASLFGAETAEGLCPTMEVLRRDAGGQACAGR